jgi:hypothetical protein
MKAPPRRAHDPVHEKAGRGVVEEVRPHGKEHSVRHPAADEHRRDHVQVEEAPVVRDADEALLRVEGREPLQTVEVPEVLRAFVDPARAEVSLAPPERLVEVAGLEAPSNEADLRLLDRLERGGADGDEVGTLGGRLGLASGQRAGRASMNGSAGNHGRAT